MLFEGQETEICVSILDRKLTNEVQRKFTVKTQQVTQNFAIGTNKQRPQCICFNSFITAFLYTRVYINNARNYKLFSFQGISPSATTDYEDIVGFGSFIVKPSPMQRCFTVRSVDDAEEEAPERLEMTAIDVDHLIEFIPDTTSVWIVDDDSKIEL